MEQVSDCRTLGCMHGINVGSSYAGGESARSQSARPEPRPAGPRQDRELPLLDARGVAELRGRIGPPPSPRPRIRTVTIPAGDQLGSGQARVTTFPTRLRGEPHQVVFAVLTEGPGSG